MSATRKSRHAVLREELRERCDRYFQLITEPGWADQSRDEARHRLAATAIKLHLFEQGMRGKP